MSEPLLMLALSPTMEKGTIAQWLKKEGDPVENGDVICEVETDKATMEYTTTAEGTLLKIVVPDGERAAVGETIGIVGEEGEDISHLLASAEPPSPAKEAPTPAASQPAKAASTPKAAPATAQGDRKIRSTPLARKLAADHGLDLRKVQGSGPLGRIVKRDIEEALATGPATMARPTPSETDTVVPLSEKRRVIASRLSQSFFSAPHFYLKVTTLVENLLASRKKHNASRSAGVSLNAYLVKLTAMALRQHPAVNASWQEENLLQHAHADIGLAVALPDGLITPIVRHAEEKGIDQIDQELKELIEKARNGKLQPEEYTGATFTITNLGSYGIEDFTAILNPPGSAILAVGAAVREPVVNAADEIVPATTMKLTLGCDHRVIDGAVGAAFLAALKGIFEDPVAALY